MKPLPFLTKISDLPFALATQLRMGNPVAIDNEFKLPSYDDIVLQYAFKIDDSYAFIIYTAYKSGPFVDFMADVTQLYNIVKNYFGSNFNSSTISKSLHDFATVFNEPDKDRYLSLAFRETEGSVMLAKRFGPAFFDNEEEFMMALYGLISGFARRLYKDVVLSLNIPDNDRTYIYDVLTKIKIFLRES